MWGKGVFLRHLKNELPGWVEKGWLGRAEGDAILRHYDRGDQVSMVSAAFGVLGVLLLLSGVITFFAANWSEMAKLTKLVLLFGSMLGAYALAIRPFSHQAYPRTWAAMLLLGTGMFGANIMLIAQTYHIESHYPNGVLFWALGALLLAWLVPVQAVMAMALALGVLWSGMETFGFDNYNFAFLVFLLVALPRIGRQGWRFAAHTAAIAFLLWSVFAYTQAFDYNRDIERLLVTEIFFITYLGFFVAGLLMRHWPKASPWSSLVQRYSAFGALDFFYVLTSPWMHSGISWWGAERYRDAFDNAAVVMVVIALVILGALAGWHHWLTGKTERPAFFGWARWLLGGCVTLLLGTLFVGGEAGGYVAMAFNVFYFAALVWLVAAGMHMNDRALVNLAFVFFAITLITRYFDTFWTLMDRSLFFMAGGVVLLGVGFLLERQRRNITGRIAQHKAATEGGAA